MFSADAASLAAMGIGFCSLLLILGRLCQCGRVRGNLVLVVPAVEGDEASQENESEKRRKQKESILTGLTVREWSPDDDDSPVESMEVDQDTPPSDETVLEAPQPLAPPINSSPASCVLGGDDCDSLAGEEEMVGCAICLSRFKPQQLVCESNNSSCQHVFHKECIVDWLMKDHNNCPMCREVYFLKTV